MPLISSRKFNTKVRATSAAGEEAYQDEFSWSSVILPFLFPALGGLLFGYDIGATSGATLSLQSPELSGTTWFNFSAVQLGLVVSGSLYGALFGSILVYPIADFLGRKRELLVAALLYFLGGSITSYAPDLNILLIGRVLYGLGIGLAMHGAPLYIAETCPSQIRGTLVSLKELFIVLGILVIISILSNLQVLSLMFTSNFRRCPLAQKLTGGVLYLSKSCTFCPLGQTQLVFLVKSSHVQDT
ncbi:putative major facilitator, sugar transporter, major facilitator superfamily [Helianthus annuus]|nr:putative major facilitator, sugar transporter, major facilitator superfamily [Helianthus annuus]